MAALTEDGLKYTEYLTAMESKLKGKNIDLIVNKKFTREPSKEKQFESFKTVSHLSFITIAKILILLNNFSFYFSSTSKSFETVCAPK